MEALAFLSLLLMPTLSPVPGDSCAFPFLRPHFNHSPPQTLSPSLVSHDLCVPSPEGLLPDPVPPPRHRLSVAIRTCPVCGISGTQPTPLNQEQSQVVSCGPRTQPVVGVVVTVLMSEPCVRPHLRGELQCRVSRLHYC